MQETMTVHKALAELKVLGARIDSAIEALDIVVANKHNNSKIGGVSVQQYAEDAKAKYQSAVTLINRRNAIKRAVTRSNATTMVTIGENQYSVAEAIDMKAQGMSYNSCLLDKIKGKLARAQRTADSENERLESRADEYIRSLYSGSDLKNMGDEIKKVRDTFITAQTMELVDPLNAGSIADKLEATISEFMSEVDSALSVSNALTTIEVEY